MGCWPWVQPSTATLRASTKKVFAHYFSPYPISIDNQAPANDYYARNYLNPAGESGKHESYGGLLRERPLGRTPYGAGIDYELEDMKTEVRRAIAIGLDGFTYDVLNPTAGTTHRVRLDKLLAAAQAVDPKFVIMLVPDMTAGAFGGATGGTNADALAGLKTLMNGVGSNAAVMKLPNGKAVVSPFGATRRDAAFWNGALNELADAGHPMALVPMPVGSWGSSSAIFNGVPLYGASSWGSRTVSGGNSLLGVPAQVHSQGLIWMGPVAPQDSRPKNQNFTESNNSAAFRAQWASAINGGADWVQLITWNDYSEDSEVAPSSKTQNGFYDLCAYYTAWFKLGTAPALQRDGIYYFHRAHSMKTSVAPPDYTKQDAGAFAAVNGPTTSTDEIEMVALLTAPATLEIVVGGQTFTQNAATAGLATFNIALREGTPVFRIRRDGTVVAQLTGATTIDNTIVYQDPLYHAGSTPTCTPAP
ncbi:MAG: hypothetical protein IPJ65_07705 [Archangiaceae bacterium]|nr:hypothetical protein [Archangiaceae bacterium]